MKKFWKILLIIGGLANIASAIKVFFFFEMIDKRDVMNLGVETFLLGLILILLSYEF